MTEPHHYVCDQCGRSFVSATIRGIHQWNNRQQGKQCEPRSEKKTKPNVPDLVQVVKEQLAVGAEGLTMMQVRSLLPKMPEPDRVEVEQVLRKDPDISVTRERRVNAAGRIQEQVVLRLAATIPAECPHLLPEQGPAT